jgi:hypothetical protein
LTRQEAEKDMRGEGAARQIYERPKEDRSLGELFAELTDETRTLIRQEVELAKVELSEKAARVGKDVGYLAAGGAVAYAGLLTLVGALVLGLSNYITLGWSALIIGIIVAFIGGFLVYRGFNDLRNANLAPRRTIQTLKETKTWMKREMK